MKIINTIFTAATLIMASTVDASVITYDSWTSNEGSSGNYVLTIDDNTSGIFNYSLTVNPRNAEPLGLFVDLGDNTIGATNLSGNDVSLFATDTSSSSCGQGCNINGLSVPTLLGDNEWELVFRLGAQGFDDIQSFNWSTSTFGLNLDDFGVVAARAQQLCETGQTLPNGNCDGSDKSYGFISPNTNPPVLVSEPYSAIFFGMGLLSLVLVRRRRL